MSLTACGQPKILVFSMGATCKGGTTAMQFSPVRLMTGDEYTRSIHALLGVSYTFSSIKFPESTNGMNFNKTIDVNSSFDTDAFLSVFLPIAKDVASKAVAANPAAVQCTGSDCDTTVAKRLIRAFFRRPSQDAEVTRFVSLVNKAATGAARYSTPLIYLMSSPNFLYIGSTRAINAPALNVTQQVDGVKARNAYELAELLSFLITSEVTPSWLIDAAEAGQLGDHNDIHDTIDKLISSSEYHLTDLFQRMFNVNRSIGFEWGAVKPPTGFASNDEYAQLANREVDEFIKGYIVNQKRPFGDIFLTDKIPMSKKTAPLYGVDTAGLDDNNFALKPLPVGTTGLAATFSANFGLSLGGEPNYIKRAVKMKDRYFCGPGTVGDPPADVPKIGDVPAGMPLRQVLDEHQAKGSTCMSCHAGIDPYGIPLEVFDGFGKYRANYQDGSKIETDVSIGGNTANSLGDLSKILYQKRYMEACLVKQVTTYTLGRYLDSDECLSRTDIQVDGVDGRTQTLSDLLTVIAEKTFTSNAWEK